MRPPLVVWQFTDGKAGHESQSRGLIAALKRRTEVHAYPISVASCRCGVGSLLWRRHPCKFDYPPPDLILACGTSTHFAALAARRACGGKLISLMKPPLPVSFYDLCLVPEHDKVRAARGNVVATRGVLNPVVAQPITADRMGQGLFLIGGPSTHYRWRGKAVVDQVIQVIDSAPARSWTLTTSRRTPADFLGELTSRISGDDIAARLRIVPVEQTRPGWMAEQLARIDLAVVSEESVSMVYESLTAGVAVSLLAMPRRRRNRVRSGMELLLKEGLLGTIGEHLAAGRWPESGPRLAEAERCADLVLNRWFVRRVEAA